MEYSSKKLSDMTFCALDLETTGTNPAFHEIVEVGIIRFTRDATRDTFESLVNPGMKIPQET
ncbi:MAG TPA: exonuclease domain-containing protein, partial [Spirochaetota bacterium]|nr:exonuclease domain-containing protein [Spirochaetota bacterium]